ncbi:coiled-coil domain-containing protein 169 isoform X1 [Magallana gigas]|uniref:coiled-coil domain-containing protein 169 isoform X1 n=1 Tax=Magallana gigas TaxID=29159 RepID=UPI00333E4487
MAVEVMDDFELEKLRAEIQQEKQMKEMLEQSAAELRATVEELEKRYDTIDNEDRSSSKQGRSSASSSDDLDWNEWKTRYETQTEINEQLERQILMLQNKVQEAKANLKDEDLAELDLRPGRGILKRRGVAFSDESSEEGNGKSVDKCIQVDRTKSNLTSILKPSPESSADSKSSKKSDLPAETKPKPLKRTIQIRTKPGSYLPAGKTPRDLKNFDDLSDANPHMIRMLEKEKNVLMNQMRDMEWRLDQESKAYHKANDERKTYSLEINSTKGSINDFSTRTKLSSSRDALDTIPGSRTPRSMGSRISLNEMDENSSSPSPRRSKIKTVRNTNYRSLRNLENEIRLMGNIPEDQRILDPKHGPIKKAAAVKSLPSLETT